VSSVVKVPAAACHRRRDTCQWPQVPFFCILDALAADRSRLRDPATVCCGDDRSSAACARRNATEHLPPRVGRHRRDTFNNCENLTPTASLQLAEHLWLPAPHSRLCSTSVVRTDRGSFGVYPNLRHVSTNLVGSICTPGTCLSVSSNPNSLQDSPRTASHPFIRRPRSLTCGHVSFLPSTSHVFRLRHNRTGNNVADVRLLRPSPSGAA
jgi:hypothetical protein